MLSCQGESKRKFFGLTARKDLAETEEQSFVLKLGKTSLRTRAFWWRCVQGQHPFPSRTRWLRPERPMVLHWRRCGRVGGRQFKKRRTEADPLPKLKINTGREGQQSLGANPISRAVLLTLGLPVIRVQKRF